MPSSAPAATTTTVPASATARPHDVAQPDPFAEEPGGDHADDDRLHRTDDRGVDDAGQLHRREEQGDVGAEGDAAPHRVADDPQPERRAAERIHTMSAEPKKAKR